MGSFGYGIYDNDEALDIANKMCDHFLKELSSAWKHKRYSEYIALTDMFLRSFHVAPVISDADIRTIHENLFLIPAEYYNSYRIGGKKKIIVNRLVIKLEKEYRL